MLRDMRIIQFGKTYSTGQPAYIVECGCETFVFTDKSDMVAFLEAYIHDPDKTEKMYYQRTNTNPEYPVPPEPTVSGQYPRGEFEAIGQPMAEGATPIQRAERRYDIDSLTRR